MNKERCTDQECFEPVVVLVLGGETGTWSVRVDLLRRKHA